MASSPINKVGRAVGKKVVIGMRREDPKRIWERRAPLTPDAVYKLISSGNIRVDVVSCGRRVFDDSEYAKAGANVVPHLHEADLVIGIKEPPIHELTQILQTQPPHKLASHTHLMFSHTIKGQSYNTPLLANFVKPAESDRTINKPYPRLIDYELITNDQDGKRAVGFGWFAGAAGVLEAFSSMAQSHLEIGIASPFLYTPRPHTHPSLDQLREAFRKIGETIATHGTPAELGPIIIGLTGHGQVAQGCLTMLSELPLEHVRPEQLPDILQRYEINGQSGVHPVSLRKIYLCHVKPEDYLQRKDGGQYDRGDYYAFPQSYESVFHMKIAPYLTLFINGTGWSPSSPRLMDNAQLKLALQKARNFPLARFTNIADISCDVEGGLEFLTQATTLSSPTYKIDLPNLPPVQMMAVDILPASIPFDASTHFSDALEPYLLELLREMKGEEPGAYAEALKRATIASQGTLTDKHKWLQDSVTAYKEASAAGRDTLELVLQGGWPGERAKTSAAMTEAEVWAEVKAAERARARTPPWRRNSMTAPVLRMLQQLAAMRSGTPGKRQVQDWIQDKSFAPPPPTPSLSVRKKKILMLGSGMVAQPAVDFIAKRSDVELVIGSNSLAELQDLSRPYDNVQYRMIDFAERNTYTHLVDEADVVISLLPASMHAGIARVCIDHGTHLVTASYTSDEMALLHAEAKKKGVLLLNEIGLDPGIDHASAQDLIDRIHKDNKQIRSFTSFCGGLPALEDSIVPLRYKFSWRPQGVLTAALNSARYRLNRKTYSIPPNAPLSPFHNIPITPEFELEGLPNRNSLPYISVYGIDYPVVTFVRGTLRYPGFSSLMNSFKALGLLNQRRKIHLHDWNTFVTQSILHRYNITDGILPSLPSLISSEKLGPLEEALEWLGLAKPTLPRPGHLEDERIKMPPLPREAMTPLDIFAYLLSQKLKYEPHERDMVVLSHEIITKHAGPPQTEDAPPSSSPEDDGGEHSLNNTPSRAVEIFTSTLITHGTHASNVGFEGARPASAMARTVGLPVALAALLILDGKVGSLAGVQKPVLPEIYKPILSGLEELGIKMEEKVRTAVAGRREEEPRVEDALTASTKESGNRRYEVGKDEIQEMPIPVRDLDKDTYWEEEEYVDWTRGKDRD